MGTESECYPSNEFESWAWRSNADGNANTVRSRWTGPPPKATGSWHSHTQGIFAFREAQRSATHWVAEVLLARLLVLLHDGTASNVRTDLAKVLVAPASFSVVPL